MGAASGRYGCRDLSLAPLADVFPNHPMRVEFCSTVARIERPRRFICRLYVDTDPSRALGDKPFAEATKQLRGHPIPPILWPHRNPLQLSVTSETAGEMSRNQRGDALSIRAHERNARPQGMPGMVFARQVQTHGLSPALSCAPIAGAHLRHFCDVIRRGPRYCMSPMLIRSLSRNLIACHAFQSRVCSSHSWQEEALWYSAARLCTTIRGRCFYSTVYGGISIAGIRADSVVYGHFPRKQNCQELGRMAHLFSAKWALK